MTTYTTTQAATAAGVTVDTIRTWARMGAVRATRISRRWAIDATSLLRRIAIGKEVAAARPTKKVNKIRFTTENMIAIGGSRWQRAGHDRVYFNNWAELAGIETTRYGTGNISSASYQGYGVSNSQGYKLLGCVDKLYFDAATGKLHVRYGHSESREATREEVFQAAVSEIRTRIAAL